MNWFFQSLFLALLICEIITVIYIRRHSFRETDDFHMISKMRHCLTKTGLIYVPFTCNGKKLNLMVDTGSTISYIDAKVAKEFGCELKDCGQSDIVGMGGTTQISKYCTLMLETPSTVTEIELPVNDFSGPFSAIEEESGVRIHGILGNNFLKASKYVIDYDKMIIFKPKQKDK